MPAAAPLLHRLLSLLQRLPLRSFPILRTGRFQTGLFRSRRHPTPAQHPPHHPSPSNPSFQPLPTAPQTPPKDTPPHLKSFLEKTLTRTSPPHPASQTVPSAAPARPMTSPTVPPLTLAPPPNTAIQPRRNALQHSPEHTPPHLKSFLEETLTARESPASHPRHLVPRPVPQPLE